jgi:hypothetical protein
MKTIKKESKGIAGLFIPAGFAAFAIAVLIKK